MIVLLVGAIYAIINAVRSRTSERKVLAQIVGAFMLTEAFRKTLARLELMEDAGIIIYALLGLILVIYGSQR